MKRMLVVQLARFGDVVQTRRLMATLVRDAGPAGEVHLVVDHSLTGLARRLYPAVAVHGLPVHRTPGPDAVAEARALFAQLAGVAFEAVYCLNFSPLAMAVAAMFPPEIQRGYRMHAGQPDKDAVLRLVFRLARDRRGGGINLADIWAHLADRPVAAATVNPLAVPGDGGVGVALAGREARRSLPPDILAPVVRTLFRTTGGREVRLFGTAEQAPAARALLHRLDPAVARACRDLTGKTDLPGLIDALTGLSVLVTPDTGAMHLAAALGVPVMAFFLSSAWCHETGPYGAGHRIWQAVTACAPCLEAAPCPHSVACLRPFDDPGLCRLVAGSTKVSPPPGLAGFVTDGDALGAVCRLVAGDDPTLARRTAVRGLVAQRLGIALGTDIGSALAVEPALTAESDWMLPPPGRPAAGEW